MDFAQKSTSAELQLATLRWREKAWPPRTSSYLESEEGKAVNTCENPWHILVYSNQWWSFGTYSWWLKLEEMNSLCSMVQDGVMFGGTVRQYVGTREHLGIVIHLQQWVEKPTDEATGKAQSSLPPEGEPFRWSWVTEAEFQPPGVFQCALWCIIPLRHSRGILHCLSFICTWFS